MYCVYLREVSDSYGGWDFEAHEGEGEEGVVLFFAQLGAHLLLLERMGFKYLHAKEFLQAI